MRFQHQFTRRVGGAGPVPVLGSDGVPTLQQQQGSDNALNARFESISGWAMQRIAVAYKGPPGALTLPAEIFLWDDLTESWYQLGATVGLLPGMFSFFNTISLILPPQGVQSANSAGSLEAFLRVHPAGGDPAGVYTFALAPDMVAF